MYSVEGLENGIVRAEHNITVLRSAIQKEEATIHEYRKMIRALKKAAETPRVIKVEVERVEEDEEDDGSPQ
jgi:HEPN domain-containing protein